MKVLVLSMLFGVLAQDQVALACDPDSEAVMIRGTDLCILTDDGRISVAEGNLRVPLPLPLKPSEVYQPMSVLKVGRKGDVVTVLVEQSCGANFRLRFTLRQLEARIANAQGLAHHRAKRYSEAAVAFEKASTLDPDTAIFATNLACSLTLAGAVDAAVAVMTKLAATNRPWVVWKLVSDPELASLHTHAAIAPLLAESGRFTLGELDGIGVGVVAKAWAVHRRWVAGHGGGRARSGGEVRVVDLKTGKVSFEISVRDRAAVERFFAVMGFTAEGVVRKAWQGEFAESWSAQFAGGKARSVRVSSSVSECPDYSDVVITLVR